MVAELKVENLLITMKNSKTKGGKTKGYKVGPFLPLFLAAFCRCFVALFTAVSRSFSLVVAHFPAHFSPQVRCPNVTNPLSGAI